MIFVSCFPLFFVLSLQRHLSGAYRPGVTLKHVYGSTKKGDKMNNSSNDGWAGVATTVLVAVVTFALTLLTGHIEDND